MYVCLCNPFSDRDVKDYLEGNSESCASVGKVYKHCSNGASPQCCSCIQTLKNIITDHTSGAVKAA